MPLQPSMALHRCESRFGPHLQVSARLIEVTRPLTAMHLWEQRKQDAAQGGEDRYWTDTDIESQTGGPGKYGTRGPAELRTRPHEKRQLAQAPTRTSSPQDGAVALHMRRGEGDGDAASPVHISILEETYLMSQDVNQRGTSTDTPFLGTTDMPRSHADTVQLKNRVQFGPIVAGILTAIASMLILTVLGLAIGASALEPREVGQGVGTAATIWGIASAIISFFLGGWVAAKTAAVAGVGSGMINGFIVGAGILALVLWLVGSGLGAAIGLIGNNVGDIANIVQDAGVSTDEAQQQTEQAATQVEAPNSFETVRDSAWGTLIGLILPLAAGAAGGAVGHNKREDVIQSGR